MAEGDFSHDARVIDQKFGRKIIRSIQHKVMVLYDVQNIRGIDVILIGDHFDVRIDGVHRLLRRDHLWFADVRRRMDNLSLQVGQIYDMLRAKNPQNAFLHSGDSLHRSVFFLYPD